VHVEELAVGFALYGVGAEAKYVAVDIFNLDFEPPGVVGKGKANFGAYGAEFGFERGGVADADPDPGSGMALIAFREEDDAFAARYSGKEIAVLPVELEAEDVGVVVDGSLEGWRPARLEWRDRIRWLGQGSSPPAFVDFRDTNKARDALHNFAHAFFRLPVVRAEQCDGLRQRFMPLDQPFDPFIDGHADSFIIVQ